MSKRYLKPYIQEASITIYKSSNVSDSSLFQYLPCPSAAAFMDVQLQVTTSSSYLPKSMCQRLYWLDVKVPSKGQCICLSDPSENGSALSGLFGNLHIGTSTTKAPHIALYHSGDEFRIATGAAGGDGGCGNIITTNSPFDFTLSIRFY